MLFLLPLAIVALLAVPLIRVYKGITTGKKAKHAFIFNLCSFAAVCLMMLAIPLTGLVGAEEAVTTVANDTKAMAYIAAALAVGLSCIGAGIAVAAAAPAAIGACSEDSKTFGKSIIFVALGESVALYGFLIAILIIFA